MGKNEEALRALWVEIQMGCPWYLMQARFLAEARLEGFLGHPGAAIDRLCMAVQLPANDHWDPDLYLQAIHEIASFETHDPQIESAIRRAEWAQLAFEVVDALTWWQIGAWWDEPKQHRLRATIAAAAAEPILIDHDPKSSWSRYILDLDHEIRTRDDWQDELAGLEESLVAAVAMSEFNDAGLRRPFADDIAALWREGDPARTAADVSDLLLDAYRPRESDESDLPGEDAARPYWHDLSAQTELEALLVRANVALGDPAAADAAFARAFEGYKEASGWIIQLEALTDGRVLASLGEVERAFDQLWESVRRSNSSRGDFDLALEALCELALLEQPSPRHPSPRDWALVSQAMAEADGIWSPGRWYESFRTRIDCIAR
ncbi:hypothetical protein AB2L57_09470 [Microbacterium sp. HA-8]|uniref:hypothetical protein n=1 Tax=Microbacterium sp. HA-8 TaxID=3234200 RepID=UPI0038F6F5FA